MTAAEALRLANEPGISVGLVAGFIRYQSHGPPPAHVLEALKGAKPEIVAMLSRFGLDASGAVAGDHPLYDLAQLGFSVRLRGDRAALDDETGQGRVPPMPLLYRFAENQTEYELVLRAPRDPDADRNRAICSAEATRCHIPSTHQRSSKHESKSALRGAPSR